MKCATQQHWLVKFIIITDTCQPEFVFFIFLGLSIIQSQLPDCSTDCLPLLVNHLFLVLPVLQIITSPSRRQQMFSPWLSSCEPVGHVALQILRHVEIHVLPLVKQQEIAVSTCIERFSGYLSNVNLHLKITSSGWNAGWRVIWDSEPWYIIIQAMVFS